MDFHLGTDVRGPEDERLGELRRIVFDPETWEVVSLVVQHAGLDEREVIVPIGAVDSADHEGIILELSSDQFSGMERFADVHNLAPPPVADNLATEDTIEPDNVPDVPPVGAATGVESIAFTPVIQEDERVDGQDDVIDHESSVWATDGEVGRLSDIQVDDETRRITGFAVTKGVLFRHEVEIPRDLVASIRPGTIVLTVEKASLADNNDE